MLSQGEKVRPWYLWRWSGAAILLTCWLAYSAVGALTDAELSVLDKAICAAVFGVLAWISSRWILSKR